MEKKENFSCNSIKKITNNSENKLKNFKIIYNNIYNSNKNEQVISNNDNILLKTEEL